MNHIAKFNDSNFPLWKLGCWLLLLQHSLVDFVTRDESHPGEYDREDNVINAEHDWMRRDVMVTYNLVATNESQQSSR